jgi:molybdopterin-synthase adenylyltransferase
LLGKPWIYSAAVGSYGVTMPIRPRETPCLRCVFPEPPPPGAVATCDTAGVIGPIGGVIGSLAAAEALKLLTGHVENLRSGLLWIDVWNNSVQSTPLGKPVTDCPACQLGRFDYLQGSTASGTAVLCGRSSVQVRPPVPRSVAFEELAGRLEAVGDVTWNPHLLRFAVDGYSLTLFPDGRAIIKGTEDPAVARGLYARYIGT